MRLYVVNIMNESDCALVKTYESISAECLQGVVCLGITMDEFQTILNGISTIKSYAITWEAEPKDHIHFILIGEKKLMINPTKRRIKQGIALIDKEPKIYQNGMFNCSRVVKPFTMLCYIFKSHKKDWFSYKTKNITKEIVTLAKITSYEKIGNLQKMVTQITVEVISHLTTPEDATVKYTLLRKNYGKPDSNYINFYHKMCQLSLDDAALEVEVRQKIKDTMPMY